MLYKDTARVLVPIVFETGTSRRLIGFDRRPETRIEVVRAVPEHELREFKKMVEDKRKGLL